jgi:hypothetical protein
VLRLLQHSAYIAVAIVRLNEKEGVCGPIYRSHNVSKVGGVECDAVQWEWAMAQK